MSTWTELRDKVKGGIDASWNTLPEAARAFLVGLGFGLLLGWLTCLLF